MTVAWSPFYDFGETDLPASCGPRHVCTFRNMRLDIQITGLLLKATWLPMFRTQARVDAADCRPEVAEHIALNLGLPGEPPETPPRPLRLRTGLRGVSTCVTLSCRTCTAIRRSSRCTGTTNAPGCSTTAPLIPPWTIDDIKVDANSLVEVRQNLPGTRSVPVSGLVWHANEREARTGAASHSAGQARGPWVLKDRLQRVGVLSIERNGMGVPTYTAPLRDVADDPDGTKAEQDTLWPALKIAQGIRSGETAGASPQRRQA